MTVPPSSQTTEHKRHKLSYALRVEIEGGVCHLGSKYVTTKFMLYSFISCTFLDNRLKRRDTMTPVFKVTTSKDSCACCTITAKVVLNSYLNNAQ